MAEEAKGEVIDRESKYFKYQKGESQTDEHYLLDMIAKMSPNSFKKIREMR